MVQKTKTLLDNDVKQLLARAAKRYRLRIPQTVVMLDYGDDLRDLFVKFRHVELKDGEPTRDGKLVLHYGEDGKLAALEIMDITAF